MPVPPARWRLRNLLSVWLAYWLTLGAVTLAPLARTLWRIARLPAGEHSSLTGAFGDGVLRVTAIVNGVPVWSGGAPLSTIALWVTGPPLAMWLLWLRTARRREANPLPGDERRPETEPSALGAGDPETVRRATESSHHASEPVRVESRPHHRPNP